MKTRNDRRGWSGEVRKNLPGQLLALILLPLSVAITFYLTKYYSAPKPEIQSISILPVTNDAPSASIRTRVLQDRYLKEFIWKEPALVNSKASRDWLDGFGTWNRECETTFESLVSTFKANISKGDTLQWNLRERDEPYVAIVDPGQNRITLGDKVIQESTSMKTETRYRRSTYYADSWPADKVLAILNDFSEELRKIKDPHRERTGDVDFRVVVLNPGDSDGVIYRDAAVEVGKETIKVRAEGNVNVKAHSFSEVTFSTRRQLSDDRDMASNKSFSELIKKGDILPAKLTLIVSDKTVSAKITIPAHSAQTK
jgi:hypothetical protein